MSFEIHLQRFDPSGAEVPKHPEVLRELECIARHVMKDAAEGEEVSVAADGNSIDIELPGGTATVHATFGQFPIQELDTLTLKVVYALAKAGDMVVITEGGKNRAILTDPSQHSRLPEGWIGKSEAVPVCFSPEQLEDLLQDWYHRQTGYTKRAFADVQSGGEATWIPGTRVDGTASFVYVEALPNETATKHQRRMFKHYRDAYETGSPNRPESGLMMAEFWRLETPASQSFYAYRYGGDSGKWLATIRDFAASETRGVGQIVNFDTFVQDDGHQFPLSACRCEKVKE